MALVVADRVRETTSSTGVGPLTLAGAPVGFRTFASVMASGDTTYYCVVSVFGADWEVGIGTFTAGTLVRNTVLSSSNSGALVAFTAGSKAVFITQPAGAAVYSLGDSIVAASGALVTISGGGTGQTTKAAAFNALSPIAAAGDLIVGSGVNSATRLAIGANTQVLTSNGTSPVWANFSVVSGVSTVSFGSTGLTPSTPTSGPIVVGGTLAVANGGTGVTTSTGSGSNVLSTNPVLNAPNIGTPSAAVLTNATGLPLTTGVTGTLGLGNGGTGQTTKAAAYNALTPITAVGDLVIGNGANSATRLAIGANTQVLTSNGTTAVWAAAASGVSTISFGTTGLTPNTATSGAVNVAGTLGIANGGTGQTTKAAAYNALTPIATTGDLVIGNGVNSATRLGIGSNTQVLTSNGTTATWAAIGAATSATTATTATNLDGATPWSLPYQSAAATTAYLPPGVSGQILISAGSAAPTWGSVVTTVTSTTDSTFNGVPVGLGGGSNALNTRVGFNTLAVNTGGQNTAFGYNVLAANTSGNSATAMGFTALQSHTTGSANTAYGDAALRLHTTGNSNSAFGVGALRDNVSGNLNTAAGSTALTFATGSNNTALGQGSGGAITTGNGNTIVGRFTGNQGGYDIRTSSNNLVLSDGDGNVKLFADASGNVGVGTASPGAKLDVSTASGNTAIISRSVAATNAGVQIAGNGNTPGTTSFDLIQDNTFAYVYQRDNKPLVFGTNNTERLRIDQAGNAGLGVVPSAWSGLYGAFQNTGNGALWSRGTDELYLSQNAFFNGTIRYVQTREASAYQQSSGRHLWFTAPSGTAGNAATLTQSLAVGLGTTLALEGATSAAGTGIAFPATQLASSNANTLDDYEEGTWTPSVGGTATYTARTGTYTKVGRFVTIFGDLTINAIGTGTQNAITGLPFVASANTPITVGFFASLATSVVFPAGFVGTTTINLQGLTAAGASATSLSILGSGSRLMFSATYEV